MIKIYSTQKKNAVSLYFETMTTIILIRKHLLTELLNTKPIKIGCEHLGCESERGRT